MSKDKRKGEPQGSPTPGKWRMHITVVHECDSPFETHKDFCEAHDPIDLLTDAIQEQIALVITTISPDGKEQNAVFAPAGLEQTTKH